MVMTRPDSRYTRFSRPLPRRSRNDTEYSPDVATATFSDSRPLTATRTGVSVSWPSSWATWQLGVLQPLVEQALELQPLLTQALASH